MVRQRRVLDVGEVFEVERPLRLRDASGGQGRGARLLVHDVVGVEVFALLLLLVDRGVHNLLQAADEIVRLAVKVGALVALAGDDERRARFVDKDGVHLVDDGEGVPALHHVLLVECHVVAQVVEAHLVVGAVGDVAGVGLAALGRGQAVDDKADGQTHEAVHLAHPFAVAAGEVVVDGDDMYALAGQGVEVGRKDGDKGLALAGLHLGDAPLMEHDAAYELHAEGLHAQHAPRGLAHGAHPAFRCHCSGL